MARGGKANLTRFTEIVLMLAQRDLIGRYRRNIFGAFTTLGIPLLFLGTYTFVFSTVIPIRLRPDASRGDYAFFLFAGLIGWNLFAEVASRAPRMFLDQAHFVRKALFPASALPLAASLGAFYYALFWLAAFVGVRVALGESLPATLILAPLVLLLFALFATGVALIVATAGVFVGDLADLIGPILALGFFLSPVLYPADRLASVSPWLVDFNPVAPLLVLLRGTLLGPVAPSLEAVIAALAWTIGALLLGFATHLRARPLLADVV